MNNLEQFDISVAFDVKNLANSNFVTKQLFYTKNLYEAYILIGNICTVTT